MTAPLFLLPPGSLDAAAAGTQVLVDGPEGRHAQAVHRLRVGEQVLVADGRGRCVAGAVAGTGPGEITVSVEHVRDEPAPTVRLVLVQALAKNGRDEQAVETATELGVDEIVPWQAARSIVQWKGERGTRALRTWEKVVHAATKQSRRTRMPDVAPLATTRDLVARAASDMLVVLHEDAPTPLTALPLPEAGQIVLVVGPEGGIGAEEVDALVAAGARTARLGPHVLRSSSAGPAALAVLLARLRW